MYATYISHMGSDNSVCDAARVSMSRKASEFTPEQNSRLITYLAKHNHWSPFSHPQITLHMTAPISIRTQCFKHTIGFSTNEQCFDAETKVLTEQGWKYWCDVTEEDKLATPSKDFKTFSFEKPIRLVQYDYEGDMYHFYSRDLDLMVTPNHEHPVSFYTKSSWTPYEKVFSIEIEQLCFPKLPAMAHFKGEDDQGYEYGLIEGAFLGDGCVSKDNARIYFHIKKDRKKTFFRELSKQTPELHWNENKQADGYSYFRCYNRYSFIGNTTNKDISWKYQSYEYYKGLFEGLMATDGSFSGSSMTWSTTSKSLHESFLQLCSLLGYDTKTHVRPATDTWNTAYKVIIKTNRPKLLKYQKKVHYKGKVYCAETSTNLLIVQRNGHGCISGNSRRYIDSSPTTYLPDSLRARPEGSIKQGSGDIHPESDRLLERLSEAYKRALEEYDYLIQQGIAPEQARFVLPQGTNTEWIWTGSLYAYARFYNLRTDSHAQKEIQDLAYQVGSIIEPLYPLSWEALTNVRS